MVMVIVSARFLYLMAVCGTLIALAFSSDCVLVRIKYVWYFLVLVMAVRIWNGKIVEDMVLIVLLVGCWRL